MTRWWRQYREHRRQARKMQNACKTILAGKPVGHSWQQFKTRLRQWRLQRFLRKNQTERYIQGRLLRPHGSPCLMDTVGNFPIYSYLGFEFTVVTAAQIGVTNLDRSLWAFRTLANRSDVFRHAQTIQIGCDPANVDKDDTKLVIVVHQDHDTSPESKEEIATAAYRDLRKAMGLAV